MNDPEDTMPGPQSASPGTLNPPLFVDAGAVAEADPANLELPRFSGQVNTVCG